MQIRFKQVNFLLSTMNSEVCHQNKLQKLEIIFHQFSILFSTLRIQEMPKFYLARSKDSELWLSSVPFALICHILCPIREVFISQVTLCSSLVVFRVFFLLLIFTLIEFETISELLWCCSSNSGSFCCHFYFIFYFYFCC